MEDQTTRTLAEIMRAAEITCASHGERTLTTSDAGWKHYASTFDLIVRGEMLINHGSYCQGIAHKSPPSSVEIMESVVMDAQSIAPYLETEAEMDANVDAQTRQAVYPDFPPTGWEEWATDLGVMDTTPRDVVKSMRDFQTICARAALLRDRLGADVYAELIALEI